MSTTFGVLKKEYENKNIPLEDIDDEMLIEVAFRWSNVYFTNELAELLGDDVKVYPMDNTAQWIYTVWDIRKSKFFISKESHS